MYHVNIQFTVDKTYISFIEEIFIKLVRSTWVALDHFHVVWQPKRSDEEEQ